MKHTPSLFLLILFLCSPLSGKTLFAQNSEKWFEVPNRTQNLISPTGFGLKKGEGFYQNGYLVYNSVGYGITDNLSVNTGLLLAGLIENTNEFFFTINPKLSIPVEKKFHVGVGSSLWFLASENDFESAGAIYGMGTFGSPNNNGSIGLGFAHDGLELVKDPLIMFASQLRATKNVSFVAEVWMLPYTEDVTFPVLSFGLRLMGKSFSFDLAYLGIGDSFDRLNLPFLTFQAPFGRN